MTAQWEERAREIAHAYSNSHSMVLLVADIAAALAAAYEEGQRGHYAWQNGEKVGRAGGFAEGLEAAATVANDYEADQSDNKEYGCPNACGDYVAQLIRALAPKEKP